MNKSLFITLLMLVFAWPAAQAQDQMIDEIVAVVGEHIVLHSDVEARVQEALGQGVPETDDLRCAIMEDLLFQKLLLHKADVDSIYLPDGQVRQELDRRMAYFISQFGSVEELEKFYGKSVEEIRDELSELLEEQLRAQTVQQSIASDVKVTPADVRAFFRTIPTDSLPLINSQVEVAHIVVTPEVTQDAIDMVIEKLEKIRTQVLAGSSFRTKAILNSEDGSAKDGGELGFMHCDDLVPEYCAAAKSLKPGEVSDVVKTEYGYHLIELIERRGDLINTRHILMKPKVLSGDLEKARIKLDSVRNLIVNDTLTFEKAARQYSDEDETRNANGVLQNPQTGSTQFDMEEMDRQLFFVIDNLEAGEVSEPVIYQTSTGEAYRIVKLNKRSKPHQANLKDDYQLLQTITQNQKRGEIMEDWIVTTISRTFVQVDERYQSCDWRYDWLKVN